jgi:hypothetical protein
MTAHEQLTDFELRSVKGSSHAEDAESTEAAEIRSAEPLFRAFRVRPSLRH